MATRPPWSDPQTETTQQIDERRRAAQRLRQRLTERRKHGLRKRHAIKLARLRDRDRNDHETTSQPTNRNANDQRRERSQPSHDMITRTPAGAALLSRLTTRPAERRAAETISHQPMPRGNPATTRHEHPERDNDHRPEPPGQQSPVINNTLGDRLSPFVPSQMVIFGGVEKSDDHRVS